ncbi:NAD(P)-dependent oxidoreductase [Rossellomorea sp. FS2]|uniref:NAD(P)-dependent oxidoreductase n=1 Tax=Rossellomorea sp. FS2 TaxID=3391447 RepID=UPI003A4E5F45
MKIAIIGGTGTAGKALTRMALDQGHHVHMLVRDPKKVSITDSSLKVVTGDAFSEDTLVDLMSECEVIINVFGQPNRAKPLYSTLTKKILRKMTHMGIKRYIGVTGGSLTILGDRKSLVNRIGAFGFSIFYGPMIKDKQLEYEILKESDRDWTLIRLPFVRDHSVTGYEVSLTDMPGLSVSPEVIAAFILDELESKRFSQQLPFISNGSVT